MEAIRLAEVKRLITLAKSKEYEVCVFGAGYIGKRMGIEMLSIFGVEVDFFCDNNKTLWQKEIVEGKKCFSPERLLLNRDKTVCFIFVGMRSIEDVIKQLSKDGVNNIVSSVELGDMQSTKEYYFPFLRGKVAIYTCIVGNYDTIQNPEYISENCDYFLVSDKEPDKNSIYKFIDINTVLPDKTLDNTRKNRFIKLHPHLLFPEYRYSIYIDGNVILRDDICECIDKIKKSRIMPLHIYSNDTYAEAIQMSRNALCDSDVVYKQMQSYYLEGFPLNFGHWLNTILIREHNNPICINIMQEWWHEISTKSQRDQLSFPYVLWKNGFTAEDVGVITDCTNTAYDDDYKFFKISLEHNVDRKKKEFMK